MVGAFIKNGLVCAVSAVGAAEPVAEFVTEPLIPETLNDALKEASEAPPVGELLYKLMFPLPLPSFDTPKTFPPGLVRLALPVLLTGILIGTDVGDPGPPCIFAV